MGETRETHPETQSHTTLTERRPVTYRDTRANTLAQRHIFPTCVLAPHSLS